MKNTDDKNQLTRTATRNNVHYKSRYMTCEAAILPQKLRTAAETMTAVVLPAAEMMEPIDDERMN